MVSMLQQNRISVCVLFLSWQKGRNRAWPWGNSCLSKKLENTYCILYCDNFFNSPTLVEELFDRGIYCLGTVRSNRENMAIMKKDKDTERGGNDFQ